MACGCLSRHVEDQLFTYSIQLDETPRWRVFARRRLDARMAFLFDLLLIVLRAEAGEGEDEE
jgi:hypothetical protein